MNHSNIYIYLNIVGRVDLDAILNGYDFGEEEPTREELKAFLEGMEDVDKVYRVTYSDGHVIQILGDFPDLESIPSSLRLCGSLKRSNLEDCQIHELYRTSARKQKESEQKDQICKALLDMQMQYVSLVELQRYSHPEINLNVSEFGALIEELHREGKVLQGYIVEDRGEIVEQFKSLVDIPEIMMNYGLKEYEDPQFNTEDALIISTFAHVDWKKKPRPPKPPFLFEAVGDIGPEDASTDGRVLCWEGEGWKTCLITDLKPNDIWHPIKAKGPGKTILKKSRGDDAN